MYIHFEQQEKKFKLVVGTVDRDIRIFESFSCRQIKTYEPEVST